MFLKIATAFRSNSCQNFDSIIYDNYLILRLVSELHYPGQPFAKNFVTAARNDVHPAAKTSVSRCMLYYLNSSNVLPGLTPVYHLNIMESDNVDFLSALTNLSRAEVRRRLANDNNAYVAYYKNQPAAFGWSASGKAFIGELNHELILPLRHKYLWNFRTLENFRGLGIYPQLLQHIVRAEQPETECFWILHSPENVSSQKGIRKAGFQFVSEVSVKNLDQVIVANQEFQYSTAISAMGFIPSQEQQATCWTCSSPYLNHKKDACCCGLKGKSCNENQFLQA